MTALGSPSEADDERASAAPPVERESKVCKFTVTMIQFCALKLFKQPGSLFTGEKMTLKLVSKRALNQVRLVCFLAQVPQVVLKAN